MTLTVGSLFAGIGGLELGLERAGMRVVWQVEKDDYCRRVLAKHWPDVERFEDVKDVGAHNLKPVDLICGGFPCQDISYAGKGAGLSGERSGLWYEYARIVGEMGPRFVVVENVPALLTRGLDAVLGTLADIGYDAEWEVVSAASLGAPHLRKRVFIVAYPARDRRTLSEYGDKGRRAAPSPRQPVRFEPVRVRSDGGAADLADADSERQQACGTDRGLGISPFQPPKHDEQTQKRGNRALGDWWSVEPNVGRVANGIPFRIQRLRALGNAVVPQVAEHIGRLIVEADKESEAVA